MTQDKLYAKKSVAMAAAKKATQKGKKHVVEEVDGQFKVVAAPEPVLETSTQIEAQTGGQALATVSQESMDQSSPDGAGAPTTEASNMEVATQEGEADKKTKKTKVTVRKRHRSFIGKEPIGDLLSTLTPADDTDTIVTFFNKDGFKGISKGGKPGYIEWKKLGNRNPWIRAENVQSWQQFQEGILVTLPRSELSDREIDNEVVMYKAVDLPDRISPTPSGDNSPETTPAEGVAAEGAA